MKKPDGKYPRLIPEFEPVDLGFKKFYQALALFVLGCAVFELLQWLVSK